MKRVTFIYSIILCLNFNTTFSQINGDKPNVNPVPPSSFQFVKYGEIPISEYTGVPNISIPIYTIAMGNKSFPIELTYHAGGIRVAEEASWVGLGWNLDVGSIVQIVNDRDDLTKDTKVKKVLPDYFHLTYYGNAVYEFPWRYQYPDLKDNTNGKFPQSTGIPQNEPYHSFVLFTNYDVPVNNNYDRHPEIFNGETGGDYTDSEPDIFKANFFGISLEFIKDFKTGDIIVLNKKGYKITSPTLLENTWEIIAPDGCHYYFEVCDEVNDFSFTTILESEGGGASGGNDIQTSSRVWHLTKIKNFNNEIINFKWLRTSEINNLTCFSQKIKYRKFVTSYNVTDFNDKIGDSFGDIAINNGVRKSYSYSNSEPQSRYYLDYIDFPNGKITFTTSSRLDIKGDVKLDKIIITNNNFKEVKNYLLNYDYFIGNTDGNSSTSIYGIDKVKKTAEELTYRLKLNSIKESSQPAYIFTYNPTQLPIKTSFGIDYWGFYNGKILNNSLIPNPKQLGITSIPDNGNDRYSSLDYAKAAILEKIQYPTGGITNFDYELNTFDNISIIGNITTGCGLRIQSIYNYINGEFISGTKYSYGTGLTNRLNFYGSYDYNIATSKTIYNMSAEVFSSNSFYTSSLVGSNSSVGYNAVTVEKINKQGQSEGKIVSFFHNNPNIFFYDEQSGLSLPARQNEKQTQNGLLQKQIIYDNLGNPKKQIENFYSNCVSEVFFGAKTTTRNQIIITRLDPQRYVYSQNLIGYYPIYEFESLLKTTAIKNFEKNGTVSENKEYEYNVNNFIKTIKTTKSTSPDLLTVDKIIENYLYPNEGLSSLYSDLFTDKERTANYFLTMDNRISEKIYKSTYKNTTFLHSQKISYKTSENLTLPSFVELKYGNNPSFLDVIYDYYDGVGNILQYHKADNINTSYIWGYNQTYPVAKIENATIAEVKAVFGGTLPVLGNGGLSLSQISTLRTRLPKAQITTYTYDLLIGMTSQTDPNGNTTYYEYDNFGRLIRIKDKDGNILKYNQYNYKQ